MPELRELSDEKKTLKKLVQKAFPKLSKGDVAKKVGEYWKVICFNLKEHAKKLVIISKYDQIVNELNSKIMAKEGKYKLFFGRLPTVPANTINPRSSGSNSNGIYFYIISFIISFITSFIII